MSPSHLFLHPPLLQLMVTQTTRCGSTLYLANQMTKWLAWSEQYVTSLAIISASCLSGLFSFTLSSALVLAPSSVTSVASLAVPCTRTILTQYTYNTTTWHTFLWFHSHSLKKKTTMSRTLVAGNAKSSCYKIFFFWQNAIECTQKLTNVTWGYIIYANIWHIFTQMLIYQCERDYPIRYHISVCVCFYLINRL